MQAIRTHLACFADVPKPPHGRFNLRNSDLVASMKMYPGAIGFMPLSEALLHGYQVVTIDGVAPTAPEYKLIIGLGFVYKKSLPGGYQAFVDYLNGRRAPGRSCARPDTFRSKGKLPPLEDQGERQ